MIICLLCKGLESKVQRSVLSKNASPLVVTLFNTRGDSPERDTQTNKVINILTEKNHVYTKRFTSNIRHKDFRPSVRPLSRSGDPPCILKRGGLESSGRILISSNGKTKRIAFFFLGGKQIFSKFSDKKKIKKIMDFLRFF